MKIGLPRALMYYEYYPFWRTFLEELGHEVVASRRTTKGLLEAGVQLAVDEACLPVKLALGHVADLIGRCDALFVPRLISTGPKGYLCPKLVGLPDIVRALPLDVPQVIDPKIDHEDGSDPARPYVRAARSLGHTRRQARDANDRAAEVQERFLASVRAGRPLALAIEDFERGEVLSAEEVRARRAAPPGPSGDGRLRIALLGHPYNIHDPYLSMEIAGHLEALGVEVVPVETVPEETSEAALGRFDANVYWLFGRRVLGPVIHFMDDGRIDRGDGEPAGVDGLIYVVSFGCGPDALLKGLVDLWAKKRPGLPVMSVVLDEHSGEGGLLTRLEAFVDLARRMHAEPPAAAPGAPEEKQELFGPAYRGPENGSHLVSFPHAGSLWIPMRAMLEDLGLNVLVPPATSRRTLDIGASHSPELACLPFKLMLGNYVEALDRGATHLLGLSSRFGSACRLHFFPAVHEAILRDLGYDFEMVCVDSGRRDSGGEMARLAQRRIRKSKWTFAKLFISTFLRKLRACEAVERLAVEIRPYEIVPGSTSAVMKESLDAIDRAEPRGLRRLMTQIAGAFGAIECDWEREPLKVGIVGELFVLLDPYANHNVEEVLGGMGVLARRNFWVTGKMLRTVWRWLEPDYAMAMRAASKYLGVDVGAECNVTVGDTVLGRRHGYDGIVHLMPFTCMPEIVAESVLPRAKADVGMPVVTFALDEQTSLAGMRTRLEAFIDLLDRGRRMGLKRPDRAAVR